MMREPGVIYEKDYMFQRQGTFKGDWEQSHFMPKLYKPVVPNWLANIIARIFNS